MIIASMSLIQVTCLLKAKLKETRTRFMTLALTRLKEVPDLRLQVQSTCTSGMLMLEATWTRRKVFMMATHKHPSHVSLGITKVTHIVEVQIPKSTPGLVLKENALELSVSTKKVSSAPLHGLMENFTLEAKMEMSMKSTLMANALQDLGASIVWSER